MSRGIKLAKREFTFANLVTMLWVAGTILSSVVLGWVTDNIVLPVGRTGELSTRTLMAATSVLVGVGVFRGIGVLGRRLGAYMAVYRLAAIYRDQTSDRYLELPIEWHHQQPSGRLLAHVSSDAEAAGGIAGPLPMAIGTAVMLLVTTVMLLTTDLLLAAIGLTMMPTIIALNQWYQGRMRRAAASAQAERGDVSAVAHESIDAALAVKTLGREHDEVVRFTEPSERLRDQMIQIGRLRSVFDPLFEVIPSLATLAVIAVGAMRIQSGDLAPGQLVTFAYLLRLVTTPMRIFAWLLSELPRNNAGLDRIDSVLDTPEQVRNGDREIPGTGGVAVELRNVTYQHRAPTGNDSDPYETIFRGVNDVTLSIPAGATVAVVGSTGSGKSTLAELLVRVIDPQSGTITLDGVPLPSLSTAALQRTVAIAFQEPFLFDDTITRNIEMGVELGPERVTDAAKIAHADRFIADQPNGYQTVVGERGSTLSGGQRQRIALARAVARHPRLLVLDDATSSVDASVEAAILAALGKTLGTVTTVIVASRMSSITLADTVVFIREGYVSATGTHDELLRAEPAYAELVSAYDVDEKQTS